MPAGPEYTASSSMPIELFLESHLMCEQEPPPVPSLSDKRPTSAPAKKIFLGAIVGGVAVLLVVIALLLFPSQPQAPPRQWMTAQARLQSALRERKPAFVFMHSLTCKSCQEMMAVTAQVMPDFEGDVILIDVNVDEPANQALLRSERLQLIPTEVFYDRQGKRREFVGVMTPEQLRTALDAIRSQSGAD